MPARVGALVFQIIRGLRGARETAAPKVLGAREVQERFPILAAVTPNGALYWEDGVMIDQDKVGQWVSQNIVRKGGEIHEHTTIQAIRVGPDGVLVECHQGRSFRGRVVINCLGPWVHGIEGTPDRGAGEHLRWCRAFNVLFEAPSPVPVAVGIQSPSGRLFFLTPRGTGCALGTEYLWHTGSPGECTATESEIGSFLKEFSSTFPGAESLVQRVSGTECGVLPAAPGVKPTPLGSERIRVSGRYIEVISTKYTTFRSQGLKIRRVVGEVLHR